MNKKYDDSLEAMSNDIREMISELKDNIMTHLHFTGILVDKFVEAGARKIATSRACGEVMHSLMLNGGSMTQSKLSEVTFRSKQATTGIIDRLERDGLVKRQAGGKDRRTKKIIITRKGIESLRETLPVALEVIKAATPSNLSPTKLQELRVILKQVREHLYKQLG
jgi:DNA-binding MarR family transcriptional regulator